MSDMAGGPGSRLGKSVEEVEHCGRQLRYNRARGKRCEMDLSCVSGETRECRINGARGKRCDMDLSPAWMKLGRVESTSEMDGSEPDWHCL
ncbi:MAG: hypothetical protein DMF03_13280 [Verrucomicrobia bacterium]|nr:MAG: hypothetical protein DMF03_13280 [Verrucomicrobiota bacterium]